MFEFIITYWIELFFSLIIIILTNLYRKITKYIKKIDTLEKGACLHLKLHIIEKYKFIKEKGYITMDEKEEVFELYKLLTETNCSNIAKDIINQINNIPLK